MSSHQQQPITKDRTAEFNHYRDEANRKRSRERFRIAEQSYRGLISNSTTTTTTSQHSRSQSAGSSFKEWFLSSVGLSIAPNLSPPNSNSTAAAETSPTTISIGTCPHCGKKLGTGLQQKIVKCRLCQIEHCQRCAQPILGLLGASDVFIACPRCRIIVSGEVGKKEFEKRVLEAKNTKVNAICMNLRELKRKADFELEKLNYLTTSLIEPTYKPNKTNSSSTITAAATSNTGTEYEIVVEQQQIVGKLLKSIEDQLKLLPLSSAFKDKNSSESRLMKGFRQFITDSLSSMVIDWRHLSEKLSQIELQTVSNIFLIVFRCRMEAKDNQAFDSMFGQKISKTLQVIEKEMHKSAMSFGVDFKKHKEHIATLIATWDTQQGFSSLISDEPSAILINTNKKQQSSANVSGTEGRMMRRAIEVLNHYMKEIESKVGIGKLPETQQALAILIDDIQSKFDV